MVIIYLETRVLKWSKMPKIANIISESFLNPNDTIFG